MHGIDAAVRPVLRINLRRAWIIPCFLKLPPTIVAMVRSIIGPENALRSATQRVWCRRNMSSRMSNAATTIARDGSDPSGHRGREHFVPAKTLEQQAEGMAPKVRNRLIGQRTVLINMVAVTLRSSTSLPQKVLRKSTCCSLPSKSKVEKLFGDWISGAICPAVIAPCEQAA